jgi:serine phosphatase RsbU (regulator of sigma subunit)
MNLYVQEGHERTEPESIFLESVADILAGTIQRQAAEQSLRTTQAELIAASRIQQSLLPQEPPNLPAYDVYGRLVPAEYAAGDYYGYLTLPDGAFAVVQADVSGHGVSAALVAASLQARIATLSDMYQDIGEILARANTALLNGIEGYHFATLNIVRIDPKSQTLSYINAGHPSGYVIGRDGALKATLDSTTVPLAIEQYAEFTASPLVTLEPNDVIVLLTDGILEAASHDGTLFGTGRTLDVLARNCGGTARNIADALIAAVVEFTRLEQPYDDMTVVVMKVFSRE